MTDCIEREGVLQAIFDLPSKIDDLGYRWVLTRAAFRTVADFPIADVAPVVHGKWVLTKADGDTYPHMNCSICGFYWRETEHRKYFHYCPGCGARMEGGLKMTDCISREAAIAETRKPRLTDAELRRRLAELPAADVAPVAHGRWEVHGQDIYCSECHNESAYNPFGASMFSDYCPNCGAKMDGGGDDARDND